MNEKRTDDGAVGGKVLEWTLGVIGAGARRGKRPRGAVDNRADKLWLRTCECIMGGRVSYIIDSETYGWAEGTLSFCFFRKTR